MSHKQNPEAKAAYYEEEVKKYSDDNYLLKNKVTQLNDLLTRLRKSYLQEIMQLRTVNKLLE